MTNTETITLPKLPETEAQLVPRVSDLVRIDPESSHMFPDNRWVILEPFQDPHNIGEVAATAMPIDEDGNGLIIGGTLRLDQVTEVVGSMTPEDMVITYENAFLRQDYKLGHQHFVDSVAGALALQAKIDEK